MADLEFNNCLFNMLLVSPGAPPGRRVSNTWWQGRCVESGGCGGCARRYSSRYEGPQWTRNCTPRPGGPTLSARGAGRPSGGRGPGARDGRGSGRRAMWARAGPGGRRPVWAVPPTHSCGRGRGGGGGRQRGRGQLRLLGRRNVGLHVFGVGHGTHLSGRGYVDGAVHDKDA